MASETQRLELILPYPPSVNTYWGFHGSRRFLTRKALIFKTAVEREVFITNFPSFGANRLLLVIKLYPPDRRIRDIDNCLKPLLDALVAAKVFDDDGQVDRIIVSRETVCNKGKCEIFIEVLTPPSMS